MERLRAAKERKRLDSSAPDYPRELPELRRRIVIEDFDFGGAVRHEINLYRSNRVDSYRVEIDGKRIGGRFGWARVLELARKAFVRVRSR